MFARPKSRKGRASLAKGNAHLTEVFAIASPGIAAALLSGRKTQMRVLPASPLAQVVPGDRVRVRESIIAARAEAGKIYATSLAKADLAIFPDGSRRYRDGRGEQGRRPTDPEHQWIGAMHMPRWASRAALIVDWTRTGRLQRIGRSDIRAEGAYPLLIGPLWRWPKPIPGLHLGAKAAFAHHWNLHHSATGERWEDDPQVTVLGFRIETLSARVGN